MEQRDKEEVNAFKESPLSNTNWTVVLCFVLFLAPAFHHAVVFLLTIPEWRWRGGQPYFPSELASVFHIKETLEVCCEGAERRETWKTQYGCLRRVGRNCGDLNQLIVSQPVTMSLMAERRLERERREKRGRERVARGQFSET